MKKKGMRVLGLKIQDLQNIDIVDVNFDNRKFIEITGKNAAGKTTLINGLFGAIIGRKYFGTEAWRVIQKGKDKALLKVTIGNDERQIEIKRSITKKTSDSGDVVTGGSMTIKDSNGDPLSQSFLDGLLSEFTIDPLGFSKKQPKDQIKIIQELGGVDVAKYDENYSEVFKERTAVNRLVNEYQGSANQQKCEQVEPVSVTELLKQKDEIDKFNLNQRKISDDVKIKTEEIEDYEQEIDIAKNDIERLQIKVETLEAKIKKTEEEVKGYPQPEHAKSTDIIMNAIENAESINAKASQWNRYQEAIALSEKTKAKADNLTTNLDKIKTDKKIAITESKLPFKNIEFDEKVGIVIDEVPFSRKSTAEQLRISTRIGTEMYPELRVLYVQDGSLLDDESYKVLKKMAEKYQYQILVETVAGGVGEDTIIMRAGKIVSAFEPKKKSVEEQVDEMDNEL